MNIENHSSTDIACCPSQLTRQGQQNTLIAQTNRVALGGIQTHEKHMYSILAIEKENHYVAVKLPEKSSTER